MSEAELMRLAIEKTREGIAAGQSPFGSIIVKDGEVVASTHNTVWRDTDPTAHAEVNCLRKAATALKTIDLKGCTLYSTCEPCPMCLAAIYWARLDGLFFASDRTDAARIGFDDARIYGELASPLAARAMPTVRLLPDEGRAVLAAWAAKPDAIRY
jgi:guanine deaminase